MNVAVAITALTSATINPYSSMVALPFPLSN